MKKFKILSLALASVMSLSMFSFAACGEEKKPDDGNKDNPPVTGSAVLKDESIKGKIIAAYPLDGNAAAYDAYTGAAKSEYDMAELGEATYVDGKAGKAIVSGTGLTIPKYNSAITQDSGVSFTYMNYAKSGENYGNDWNLLISSGYMSVTYGNLSGALKDAYPSAPGVVIGRGAYAESYYQTARETLTTAQLQTWNSNAGYNAGMYEGDAEEVTAISAIAKEFADKWTVMTVNITKDSVSFYRNGALAYTYGDTIAGRNASWMIADFIDLDEGNSETKLTAFGGACGDVDNIVVGQALTAEEVLALYNDLAGATKTMADVTVSSAMNADDATKSEADAAAKAEAIAKYKAAVEATIPTPVVADETKGEYTIGDVNYTYAWWVAQCVDGYTYDVIKDAEGNFDMTINFVQWISVNDTTADLTYETDLYINGAFDSAVRPNAVAGWGNAVPTITSSESYNADTILFDMTGAACTYNVKNDGANLVVTQTYVPQFAGVTYSATKEVALEDGSTYTATYEFTVAESITVTATFVDYNLNEFTGVRFGVSKTCLVVTGLTGGNRTAVA